MSSDSTSRTWHHGLVARWWAEFNHGGDDIETFQYLLNESAPVLDAGCGTGRILMPLRSRGIDIDGSDTSADMLQWCARALEEEGLTANLYAQAMHALALPRRYATIIVCGAFGLGGTRAQDLEGLRRLRAHLLPGGHLLMDHYLPNLEDVKGWPAWVERPTLPRSWPQRGDRRRAKDGTELELRVRQFDFDPLAQRTTLEMRAAQYQGDAEIAVETHRIEINLYFMSEIELMLRAAGFSTVDVQAFGAYRPPRPWEDKRLLFVAGDQ